MNQNSMKVRILSFRKIFPPFMSSQLTYTSTKSLTTLGKQNPKKEKEEEKENGVTNNRNYTACERESMNKKAKPK